MAKLNVLKKKSLLTKYHHLVEAEASPAEASNVIAEAEKDLPADHVTELVEALYGLDPAPTRMPDTPAAEEKDEVPASIKGKKFYDIFRGQWHAVESVKGFDGRDHVVLWEFRPEGKAIRTGVPMEPSKAKEFNDGKRLRTGRTFTEQMIEVGSTDPIYDELPDPTARKKVN